jgi:hypothetical protein
MEEHVTFRKYLQITEQIEIMSGQLMPQVFEVDISQAKFISKGILEDNFFKLIEKLIERG